MGLTRRKALGRLVGGFGGLALAQNKPNIVVILADDLGYCDTELFGCTGIPTPNIKSIAREGVLFSSGYVAAPVCSPSRAALLTGRYQQRFGFEFNAGALERALANQEMGLPVSEITLPEVLKRAGYATGMVGKWHLGMHEKFHPVRRGFDEYFGFLFGANTYIDPGAPGVKTIGVGEYTSLVSACGKLNPIYRNTTPVDEPEYLTDAFAREATAFIGRHQSHPFFLYTAFNAPHTPFQATEKYLTRFPDIKDERRRVYAAMVSALDDAVGAILSKLRQAGLERDTLVVFLSDNGCATYTNACTNDPLRFGKLTHLEGGFRVPFAMRWPGRLKAGGVYGQPVSSLDLFPTAVTAAGGRMPAGRPYDGVDLIPYLTGRDKAAPHEILCWRNGPNSAIRKGQWKLFQAGRTPFLFDLSADIGERTNLASQRPQIVRELKTAYAKWESQMKPPLWPCRKLEGTWDFEGVKLEVCV